MQTLQQYIDDYAISHQHGANQVIHLLCVPAIFWSIVAVGYLTPVGAWLGLTGAAAGWVNGATLGVVPVMVFYGMLGRSSLLTGMVWFALSYLLSAALLAVQAPLLWIAGIVFVIAWIVQFIGHKIEGAKPSFLDDLFFLLIGPLFVQQKLNRLAVTGSIHAS